MITYRMRFSIATACAVALLAGLVPASVYAFASMAKVADRDKSGTTGGQEKEGGSQAAILKALTSRASFQAEGTGLAWWVSPSPLRASNFGDKSNRPMKFVKSQRLSRTVTYSQEMSR